ncbi:4Fe-4S dicluster domain-containing protein [Edwardsiella tarda]|uniref:4Fe-4S dicluster domain-containing protein n=1 Tax=Edwardsiella tarda TaxID=636 RepID=UPI000D51C0F7|nr:4Fe-4S dicluster domain-containing protein [Edwardsiella tarda]UCQ10464.1 4Fe-4S dicluster domain-containing protein [Edwardsiella tarda]WGE30074.1 4Fe-4S dicluster domain-containing protein [Edwardsiella tarda]
MSLTRRNFIIGLGTVIFFTGPCRAGNAEAGMRTRYAMIHDESRCTGCNLCARACRKTHRVPRQGSRLSILHIPLAEDEQATTYRYFRQACQHCDQAPCIDVCPTGASWRDENGIVRVNPADCIGCGYCVSACPYQARYLDPRRHVADKCDFCCESRLAKGFPPICVSVCPQQALIFGDEESPEIKRWLQENRYEQYWLPGTGKPHQYRRAAQHVIPKG